MATPPSESLHPRQPTELAQSPTFHLFPNLSVELRLEIWSWSVLSLPPRFILLAASKAPRPNELVPVIATTPQPSLLRVCRESRVTALKRYQATQAGYTKHPYFMDVASDAVVIDLPSFWTLPESFTEHLDSVKLLNDFDIKPATFAIFDPLNLLQVQNSTWPLDKHIPNYMEIFYLLLRLQFFTQIIIVKPEIPEPEFTNGIYYPPNYEIYRFMDFARNIQIFKTFCETADKYPGDAIERIKYRGTGVRHWGVEKIQDVMASSFQPVYTAGGGKSSAAQNGGREPDDSAEELLFYMKDDTFPLAQLEMGRGGEQI